MSKALLITGATGKQGGATIDALISSPSHTTDYTILAVTRNPSSASAQALQTKSPSIKLVAGDFNDVPAIFAAAEAVQLVGMPEGRIPLAQATTYLASAPKSNASYAAIGRALDDVRQHGLGRGRDRLSVARVFAHLIAHLAALVAWECWTWRACGPVTRIRKVSLMSSLPCPVSPATRL